LIKNSTEAKHLAEVEPNFFELSQIATNKPIKSEDQVAAKTEAEAAHFESVNH